MRVVHIPIMPNTILVSIQPITADPLPISSVENPFPLPPSGFPVTGSLGSSFQPSSSFFTTSFFFNKDGEIGEGENRDTGEKLDDFRLGKTSSKPICVCAARERALMAAAV